MNIGGPTWIRATITVIGIFAAVLAVARLDSAINILALFPREEPHAELWWSLAGASIGPVLLLVSAFFFIRYCDRIAVLVLKDNDSAVPYWERAAHRLVMIACGVLVISWALPDAAQIAQNMAMSQSERTPDQLRDDVQRSTWLALTHMIIQTIIGAYLIVGAPYFVKWNVRRIEQLSDRQTN